MCLDCLIFDVDCLMCDLTVLYDRLVPPMCIDSLLSGDDKSNMARIHESVTILFLTLNVGHAGVSAEAMVRTLHNRFTSTLMTLLSVTR